MHRIFLLLSITLLFSCGNEKELQLPQIENAKINQINDVSPAYLFYDETQPDSLELNRKNLISTTNWLVNVDKRLTLKQAIPKIKFLQEKKANSSHKNENAKNYYTCHDLSKNTLGFLEFTAVAYHEMPFFNYQIKQSNFQQDKTFQIDVHSSEEIHLYFSEEQAGPIQTNIEHLIDDIVNKLSTIKEDITVLLSFKNSISFQNYISIKWKISKLNLEYVSISTNEFIY